MNTSKSIVILTGAGISAESGLATFRGAGGMWENHPVEEVASLEGFHRNPKLVQEFYNSRRRDLLKNETRPNPAHEALALLERNWKGPFLLVTQNVDNLHERAGSQKLIHMHGELLKARCLKTGRVFEWTADITPDTTCPCCDEANRMRPHVVWFGETPLEMERIHGALSRCDIFISIGTSGQVYPAAGFVDMVPGGCMTVEINAESTAISTNFMEHKIGPASRNVPSFVEKLLQG